MTIQCKIALKCAGLNIFLFFSLLSCLPGGETASDQKELVFRGETMGTRYKIRFLIPEEKQKVRHYKKDIEAILSGVNQEMSTYLPDSELSRFNRAEPEILVSLGPEICQVLALGLEIGRLTGGAYDITVGPLVDLWGFGPRERRRVPSREAVEATRQKVNHTGLILDRKAGTARKSMEMDVDLSSIAKGYAVDRVAGYLAKTGFSNYMVEIGGEIKTGGNNLRGDPWKIGIRTPAVNARSLQRVFRLSGEALATSGDYENYFIANGKRYSHIIDPRTGYPVDHQLASVSVFHPSCAYADALATGLLVMGRKEGYALATERGIPALFIEAGNGGRWREYLTPALSNQVASRSSKR